MVDGSNIGYDVSQIFVRHGRIAPLWGHGHARRVARLAGRATFQDEFKQLLVALTFDERTGGKVLAQIWQSLGIRSVAGGTGSGK